jgi:hypothetical protein
VLSGTGWSYPSESDSGTVASNTSFATPNQNARISVSANTAKKLHLSNRAITLASAHFSGKAGKTVIVA